MGQGERADARRAGQPNRLDRGGSIRIWANEGWAPPGTPPATAPGTPVPQPGSVTTTVPQGIEVTIERSDGLRYRRVLLVG